MARNTGQPARTLGSVSIRAREHPDSTAVLTWICEHITDLDITGEPGGDVFLVVDEPETAAEHTDHGRPGVHVATGPPLPTPPSGGAGVWCLAAPEWLGSGSAAGLRSVGSAIPRRSPRWRSGDVVLAHIVVPPAAEADRVECLTREILALAASLPASVTLRVSVQGSLGEDWAPRLAAAAERIEITRSDGRLVLDGVRAAAVSPSPVAFGQAQYARVPMLALPALDEGQEIVAGAASLLAAPREAGDTPPGPLFGTSVLAGDASARDMDGRALQRVARQLRQLVLAPL
ncbi:hypothetical protein GCM10010420_36530 [Streptomyces glaucosporus]|uniref:Uncharacterized protein n=1 Tax=Streptomyces glaucosporus TaxID=284044 RepID=A0ABN3IIH7_9ACTN